MVRVMVGVVMEAEMEWLRRARRGAGQAGGRSEVGSSCLKEDPLNRAIVQASPGSSLLDVESPPCPTLPVSHLVGELVFVLLVTTKVFMLSMYEVLYVTMMRLSEGILSNLHCKVLCQKGKVGKWGKMWI